MPFNNPVMAGKNLVRQMMQSVNFVTGLSGWALFKNGNAEFSDGVFRGTIEAATFQGTDFFINALGEFRYNGTPGPNNLIYTNVSAATVDQFGNQVPAGVTTYSLVFLGLAEQVGSGGIFTALSNSAGASQQGSWVTGSFFYHDTNGWRGNVPMGAQNPALGLGSFETWHNMTLLNGWSLGAGGFAQFKLELNNKVSVRGVNVIPGTVTTGTSIWTPPAGYVPTAIRQSVGVIVEVGTETFSADYPRLDAEPTGLMTNNLTATMTRVGWNDSYALD